jgi:hypothetical protein
MRRGGRGRPHLRSIFPILTNYSISFLRLVHNLHRQYRRMKIEGEMIDGLLWSRRSLISHGHNHHLEILHLYLSTSSVNPAFHSFLPIRLSKHPAQGKVSPYPAVLRARPSPHVGLRTYLSLGPLLRPLPTSPHRLITRTTNISSHSDIRSRL